MIKCKLQIKTNNKLLEQIKRLKDGTITVGWWGDDKEPNGLLVAENAYIQEHGATIHFETQTGKTATIHIPPRPFLLITINRNLKKWKEFWKKGFKKYLDGQIEYKTLLDRLGQLVKADIQETMLSNVSPENSPITKAIKRAKGSPDITLIDSGTRYNKIKVRSEEHK